MKVLLANVNYLSPFIKRARIAFISLFILVAAIFLFIMIAWAVTAVGFAINIIN